MCSCDLSELGTLYPCQAAPLLCGQGWQQCQCLDDDCSSTVLSDCHALCWFFGPEGEPCEDLGTPVDELCNAHDDDCDDAVDEDLVRGCYTGPPETEGQGNCVGGEQQCLFGVWGQDVGDGFEPGLCPGEVLPAPKDYCNGIDEDCDGVVDAGTEMTATDIVLVIDWSGSMDQELNAVLGALLAFAQAYSDDTLLRWSLLIGPVGGDLNTEVLHRVQDLASFETFMGTMLSLESYPMNGMHEMLLDALWIILGGGLQDKSWSSIGGSTPTLQDFGLAWRDDANKVVIVWTDEMPQSQLEPAVTPTDLGALMAGVEELRTYTFTPLLEQGNWGPLATAGSGHWYELSSSTSQMFASLMDILDDAVCL